MSKKKTLLKKIKFVIINMVKKIDKSITKQKKKEIYNETLRKKNKYKNSVRNLRKGGIPKLRNIKTKK